MNTARGPTPTPVTRRHALLLPLAMGPVAMPALATTSMHPMPLTTAPTPTPAGGNTALRQAVETYARAWERNDLQALLSCYHADFTLNYFGRNALAGRHVGRAASLKVLAEVRQRTGRQLKAITALLIGEDRAAMLTRELVLNQGQPLEVERLYVYTASGTQLRECWVYDQDQRQMDAIIGA